MLLFEEWNTGQTIPSKVYLHFYLKSRKFWIPFKLQIGFTNKNYMYALLMLLWQLLLDFSSACCILLFVSFRSLNCDDLKIVIYTIAKSLTLVCTNCLVILKKTFKCIVRFYLNKNRNKNKKSTMLGKAQCVPAVLKHSVYFYRFDL